MQSLVQTYPSTCPTTLGEPVPYRIGWVVGSGASIRWLNPEQQMPEHRTLDPSRDHYGIGQCMAGTDTQVVSAAVAFEYMRRMGMKREQVLYGLTDAEIDSLQLPPCYA